MMGADNCWSAPVLEQEPEEPRGNGQFSCGDERVLLRKDILEIECWRL